MNIRAYAAIAAVAASLSFAGAASATVITSGAFTLEDGVFGGQLGVHSTGSQSGVTSASAFVNQDNSAVTFTSSGLFDLAVNGQGEATIVGDPTLANLTVTFAKTWGSVTFDLETLTQTSSAMTLLVNGTSLFSGCSICSLGNGANKFVLSGPDIQTLTFNFDPAISDAKQFRLLEPDTTTAVPEPASWAMMIVGMLGLGTALRLARKPAPVLG